MCPQVLYGARGALFRDVARMGGTPWILLHAKKLFQTRDVGGETSAMPMHVCETLQKYLHHDIPTPMSDGEQCTKYGLPTEDGHNLSEEENIQDSSTNQRYEMKGGSSSDPSYKDVTMDQLFTLLSPPW